MNPPNSGYEKDPDKGRNSEDNGNGNRVRDYIITDLKYDVENLKKAVASLSTSIDKLPMALLKWLVPTAIGLIAAFVAIAILAAKAF